MAIKSFGVVLSAAGLGLAVSFQAGLFNLGGDVQFLIGGLGAFIAVTLAAGIVPPPLAPVTTPSLQAALQGGVAGVANESLAPIAAAVADRLQSRIDGQPC